MHSPEEILLVRRWLSINEGYERDQIAKDPFESEHHRGESEMFKKAFDIITELTSKG